jgi:hypothetical protein
MDSTDTLAFLTWFPCGAILFISICRMNAMQGKGVLWRVKLEYALYVAISCGVVLAPLVGEWPGMVMFLAMCALALALLCSARAWSGDKVPQEATDFGQLQPTRRWFRTHMPRFLERWTRDARSSHFGDS